MAKLKNPKNKGSEFERRVGRQLSLWLTNGERDNILNRNIISGGAHTVAVSKGKVANIPGDLMAAHPLAFEFLSVFSVECKHRASLEFDAFIWDRNGKSFLFDTIRHTAKQAADQNLHWMVVAKQNRQETLLIVSQEVGACLEDCQPYINALHHHSMHNGRFVVYPFDKVLSMIKPERFLSVLKKVAPLRINTHASKRRPLTFKV